MNAWFMPHHRRTRAARSRVGRSVLWALALGLGLGGTPAQGDGGTRFQYHAHDLPPFAYPQPRRLGGFAVDLVETFCGSFGLCADAELVPFARAMVQVGKAGPPDSFLLLARCPEREDRFKWVGPVFESQVVFFKQRGRALTVERLEDLRGLVVGVHRGNRDHSFLQAKGIGPLSASDTQAHTLRMLAAGRVDVTPMSEAVFPHAARSAGLDPDDFDRTGLELYPSTLYFGFSLSTDDAVIERWQRALSATRATGRYETLYHRYFGGAGHTGVLELARSP